MRTNRVRHRAALLTLLLPLLVLAGCAGSGGDGVARAAGGGTGAAGVAAGEGPAPAEDIDERGRQFAQCMRDHDIDMPDPVDGRITVRGKPGEEAKMDEAQKACQQYAPGAGGEKADAALIEQQRAFAQCMRDNGLPQFPDPQPDGRMEINKGSGIEPDSEAFKAAEAACRNLQPEPPRGDEGTSEGGGS